MKDVSRPSSEGGRWALRILGSVLMIGAIVSLVVYWASISIVLKDYYTKGFRLRGDLTSTILLTAILKLVASIVSFALGFWLARLSRKKPDATGTSSDSALESRTVQAVAPVRPAPAARAPRVQLCNVLNAGPGTRQIWQFDASNGFALRRDSISTPDQSMPPGLVAKSWSSLWQKKLNVAWLPPENVFIRVAQFPKSELGETRSMVEFQLEKLSPIPVTQAVWSMHVLPHSSGNMQTVVVVIAQRNSVEEFLGKLESQGFMADRLELPLLDQLQATQITGDGAWIYPESQGGANSALVAWWYGGVLQNLDLINLSAGTDQAATLKDHLMQMTWAGELEGWLTSSPKWHLVADEATAAVWGPLLQKGLEQSVETSPPLSREELASRTAQRAAQTEQKDNLLPAEFAARYHQQFVDRLWIRGLGSVVLIYVACVAVYFVATLFLGLQTRKMEQQVADSGRSYTNAIRLKQEYDVLKRRQDLKFAALDCWEAVAELQPENVTLESFRFSDGETLNLAGTAPSTESLAISEFASKLSKTSVRGQALFDGRKGTGLQTHALPGGAISWSFNLELRRTEGLK